MVIINKDIVKELVLRSFWNTFGEPEFIIRSYQTLDNEQDGYIYLGYISFYDGNFSANLELPLIASGNVPFGFVGNMQGIMYNLPIMFNHVTWIASGASTSAWFEGYRMKIID